MKRIIVPLALLVMLTGCTALTAPPGEHVDAYDLPSHVGGDSGIS